MKNEYVIVQVSKEARQMLKVISAKKSKSAKEYLSELIVKDYENIDN